ncbi:hypothetical protein B7R74_08675 [Yersinia pseudotuberculosis]|nr:hypothetical protein B7R74_08675 [Yersinia pseudotuberculosis]
MQRQAMGVALHICNTFILNYCIAFNCYGADVEKHRHFFVCRAWRGDKNLTVRPRSAKQNKTKQNKTDEPLI